MNVTLFALGILAGIVNAILPNLPADVAAVAKDVLRVVEDILEPPTPPTRR